jgi:hypothetical protein
MASERIAGRDSFGRAAAAHRRSEEGVAVVVVIALLAILLVYVAGNARTLHLLSRDIKLVEQQQLRRIAEPGPRRNSIPTNVVGHIEGPASARPESP